MWGKCIFVNLFSKFDTIDGHSLLPGGLLVRILGGSFSVRGGSLGSGGGYSIFGTGGRSLLHEKKVAQFKMKINGMLSLIVEFSLANSWTNDTTMKIKLVFRYILS